MSSHIWNCDICNGPYWIGQENIVEIKGEQWAVCNGCVGAFEDLINERRAEGERQEDWNDSLRPNKD